MAKVIVERPRLHGSTKYRARRAILKEQTRYIERSGDYDYDLLETGRESLRAWASKMLGWDRKELNEFLSPLRRFMLSRVGRRWDDVFSEVCERINPSNACQLHIWQHAKDYVETRTYIGDDGEVWYSPDYCYGSSRYRYGMGGTRDIETWNRPIGDSYAVVYVDPRDGCLRENVAYTRKPRYRYSYPRYDGRVEISKWLQGHFLKGAWYLIELAPMPEYVWKPWTSKQIARFEAQLADDSSTRWYGSSELGQYKKHKDGRWVVATYHDVAIRDIMKAYGLGGDFRVSHDNGWRKIIYGRTEVYAVRRWQMSGADLRKYGIRAAKEFPELPPLVNGEE